ncbi:hypothetical protein [Streptomyces caatingaensis]|uniref:Ig-like domain-containing protein n=1 Tax=Streptomyces caatingaensis TaxID=1678637 RepID=A0A0K9XBQ9_9ACTN|nr:hypothetical protein [Streptomyces caatingaensis]KNB50839.1 hypothetical protein AC230_20650 [Streptomyces caatingaensis]
MRIPWRLTSVVTAAALLGGLFLHNVSSARAAQIITCDHSWTMTFEPGLTITPQPKVSVRVGNPDGTLSRCTGDPAISAATFVTEGAGSNVTCAAGIYGNEAGSTDHVVWNATSGETAMDYSWTMRPVGDLLSVSTPLSGGITQGRYKGGTWTATIDPTRSTIGLTDCMAPGGLKSMKIAGTLIITTPG